MNLLDRIRNFVYRRQPGDPRIYVAPRQAGVLVTEDTALTFGAVWAAVSLISRTVAALPWHVYERTGEGRRPVEGSVAWLLNNRPNTEMSAFAFRESLVLHALTWGNGYAEIVRDAAQRPAALWLLAPDRTRPKRTDAGELVYEVTLDDGTTVILPPERVLHVHGMGFDGLVGYSPIAMAARSIGVGMAQDVFGQAFYANGTTFGALIEMPSGLNADQIKTLEAHYNDRSRGPDKAFRVQVGSAGTKVHQMAMPLTDAQFLESRKFSVTEVARWYGVPPHKIADLDRATNNNIEHQGIEFVTDAIVPWAIRLEQEANAKLFSARAQGRVYTKLNVSSLMRGDSKSRAEYYRAMLQAGVMTINEVRALEELNGIGPNGDEQLVQLNQTTLERIINPPEPVATPAPEPAPQPEPAPNNVIRQEALAFLRAQRNNQ
jgi:HK97 family phage portal protein